MTKYAIIPLLLVLLIPVAYGEIYIDENGHNDTKLNYGVGQQIYFANHDSIDHFVTVIQNDIEYSGNATSGNSFLFVPVVCGDIHYSISGFGNNGMIEVVCNELESVEEEIEPVVNATNTVVNTEPSITTTQNILGNGMNTVTISGTNFSTAQTIDIQLTHEGEIFGTYKTTTTNKGEFSLVVEVPVDKVGVFDVDVLLGEVTISSGFTQTESNPTTTTTPTTVESSPTTTTINSTTPNTSTQWDQYILDLDANDRLALIKAVMKYFLS